MKKADQTLNKGTVYEHTVDLKCKFKLPLDGTSQNCTWQETHPLQWLVTYTPHVWVRPSPAPTHSPSSSFQQLNLIHTDSITGFIFISDHSSY